MCDEIKEVGKGPPNLREEVDKLLEEVQMRARKSMGISMEIERILVGARDKEIDDAEKEKEPNCWLTQVAKGLRSILRAMRQIEEANKAVMSGLGVREEEIHE